MDDVFDTSGRPPSDRHDVGVTETRADLSGAFDELGEMWWGHEKSREGGFDPSMQFDDDVLRAVVEPLLGSLDAPITDAVDIASWMGLASAQLSGGRLHPVVRDRAEEALGLVLADGALDGYPALDARCYRLEALRLRRALAAGRWPDTTVALHRGDVLQYRGPGRRAHLLRVRAVDEDSATVRVLAWNGLHPPVDFDALADREIDGRVWPVVETRVLWAYGDDLHESGFRVVGRVRPRPGDEQPAVMTGSWSTVAGVLHGR